MTSATTAPLLTSGDRLKQSRVWPWFAGALTLIIFDQVTKALVRNYLILGHPVPLIGKSLVRLTYVLNPGIAFGVDILGIRPLLFFGWLAAVVLTIYLYRLARRRDALRWPVLLFLAGAIGNSLDRLFFGKVTDFIDVDMPDFIMERFAVFNVADSCVSIGIVLLVLMVLFGRTPARQGDLSDSPHGSETSAQINDINNSELNDRSSNQPDSLPPHDRSGSTTDTD